MAALSQRTAVGLVEKTLWPIREKDRERLGKIDNWLRWEHEDPRLPRGATAELRYLLELSKTPWLHLVVTTLAQAMYVDGYKSPGAADNAAVWRTWNANDMDSRQIAVHRAALSFGQAYMTVLPGVDFNGDPRSVLRGVSPRRMVTAWADEGADDWPLYAMHWRHSGDSHQVQVYDEYGIYYLDVNSSGEASFIEFQSYGVDPGVCPVVRFAGQLDLEGRAIGEAEPLIPLAARIDKTSYDRLLTQHFNSWKKITASGLAEFADDQQEANQKKLRMRQDDILVAEDPDVKFGTLPETSLSGFVDAYKQDVASLAAVAQVPPTALTGDVANLSADAIAELRAGLTQKVYERQTAFGKSHAQALRLAARLEGDAESANDDMARVKWQDVSVRSMSQAADALGKYATMLGVPAQALWERIPGVDQTDVEEWKALASEGDALASLQGLLAQQANGTPPPANTPPANPQQPPLP